MVGNTPYGKRHTYRTKPVYASLISQIKVCAHPNQFDAFFNPKEPSENNAKNITPLSIGQLEKPTSYRATDVAWHWTLAKIQ